MSAGTRDGAANAGFADDCLAPQEYTRHCLQL